MDDLSGNRVAVLIDYENLFIEFNKKIKPHEPIDWEEVLKAAKRYGGPLICKAYADWSGNWTVQDKFSSMGVQPITVPSKGSGRNSVDVRIAVDALDMLIIKNKDIKTLVLASGDGDFTALVNYLKDYGKYVVGIGVEGATARYLEGACNEFKYLVKGSELVDAGQKPVEDMKEPQPAVTKIAPADERQKNQPQKAPDPENRVEQALQKYLAILHENKIPIEPTRQRAYIITKSFWKLKKYGGIRLVDIKEKITSYFASYQPGIGKGHVEESIQQVIMANCLDFDDGSGDPAQPVPLSERKASLKSSLSDPADLLRAIDKFLVEIVKRETSPEEIDCAALSTVLYGTAQKAWLVKKAKRLVDETNQTPPN